MVKIFYLLKYLEFLVANMKLHSALKEERLKEAFDFYDEVRENTLIF